MSVRFDSRRLYFELHVRQDKFDKEIIKQKKKGKEQPLKEKRLVVFRREHEKN